MEERFGALSEGVRMFLLNKLFQHRPAEIARLEGRKDYSSIRGLIIRASNQLRAGEISLFEHDPEKEKKANAKVEAKKPKEILSRENYCGEC